ncbi:MAG TPA: GNAT family N-acetyltransferase [Candidatus Methanoperedens sp.]|nr:GNAT family N-acetyltransferase [Candidatus Methanoperedens sp.]
MRLAIVNGFIPGALGRVVELHGAYYARHWGFGVFFEAKMAADMAELANRYDERRDGFWTVSRDGRVEASIAIDGRDAPAGAAALRWYIVSDALRGQGCGRRLLATAVDFCRARRYPRVSLWTFGGLDAARHLYEQAGFRLAEEQRGSRWGTEVTEQRFELRLG